MALHFLGAGAALFVLGAASVTVMKAAAPLIGRTLRPVVRAAVREGMLIQRQVQEVAQEAWQDVQDITAEAQAELNPPAKGDEKTS
jgi:ABC-type protease/lipase transport system fused ATPase/permease subunit